MGKVSIEEFLKNINMTQYIDEFKNRGVSEISDLKYGVSTNIYETQNREDIRKLLSQFVDNKDMMILLKELEKRNKKEEVKSGLNIGFAIIGFVIILIIILMVVS